VSLYLEAVQIYGLETAESASKTVDHQNGVGFGDPRFGSNAGER
jgi:hypothetical protein